MALSTEEITKVNDLYKQLDLMTAENSLLKDQLGRRFDDIERLIEELGSKWDANSKKSSTK